MKLVRIILVAIGAILCIQLWNTNAFEQPENIENALELENEPSTIPVIVPPIEIEPIPTPPAEIPVSSINSQQPVAVPTIQPSFTVQPNIPAEIPAPFTTQTIPEQPVTNMPAPTTVETLSLISEFEGGKLFHKGTLKIVQLNGSCSANANIWLQMGRQYGQLLKEEINNNWQKQVVESFYSRNIVTAKQLDQFMARTFELYPEKLKNILRGISQTSGLSVNDLIALDMYIGLAMFLDIHRYGCSAFAAKGTATGNGPLIFARNFDYPEYFRNFNENTALVVYNPHDGSIPVASFVYAGQMSITTFGANAKGLGGGFNNGSLSGGNQVVVNRTPINTLFFEYLLDSDSLTALDGRLQATRAFYATILGVAGPDQAYSYEFPTFGLARRGTDTNGIMVMTNDFIDPQWGIARPVHALGSDPTFSYERRQTLSRLTSEYLGKINPRIVQEIMDKQMTPDCISCGVTKIVKTGDVTIIQVIFEPASLKCWFKRPTYDNNWIEVNLNELFSK